MQASQNEVDLKIEGIVTCETTTLDSESQTRLESVLEEPVYAVVLSTLVSDGSEAAITGATAYEICIKDVTKEARTYRNQSMSDLDILWSKEYSPEAYAIVRDELAAKMEAAGITDVSFEVYPEHFYPKFAIHQGGNLVVEVYFLPDCARNIHHLRELTHQEQLLEGQNARQLYSMAQQTIQESLVISIPNNEDAAMLTRIKSPTPHNVDFVGPYREVNPLRIYSPENIDLMLNNATSLNDLESSYVTLMRLKLSNLRGIVKASEQTLYNLNWEEVSSPQQLAQRLREQGTSLDIEPEAIDATVEKLDDWYKRQAQKYFVRSIQADPIRSVTWLGQANLVSEVVPDISVETSDFFDYRRGADREKSLCLSEVGRAVLLESHPSNINTVIAALIISSGETDIPLAQAAVLDLASNWTEGDQTYRGMGVDNLIDTKFDPEDVLEKLRSYQNTEFFTKAKSDCAVTLGHDPSSSELNSYIRSHVISDSEFHLKMHDNIVEVLTS